MHEPITTGPTATAVPWTPDMMTPQMAPPSAVPAPIHAPMQNAAPAQPQYQPAQQYHAPQPMIARPAAQQPYSHVAPPAAQQPHPQMAQPAPHQPVAPQPVLAQPIAPQAFVPQPHIPSPQAVQQHMQPAQYVPPAQPPHHAATPTTPQMGQPQYAPALGAPQIMQAAIPPALAPHLRVPQQISAQIPAVGQAVNVESKSFIAKLLKRSPKPNLPETNVQLPAASGSLFNKSFALGGLAGLVIGAFVLPMVLGLVGGKAPNLTQAQAGSLPAFDVAPAVSDVDGFKADTFIDNAMSTNAP